MRRDEVAKTTPYGMWRYRDAYRRAGTYVLVQFPEQPVPHFSLLGQSIELTLKAFLLKQGISLKDLKDKSGHDLRKLVDKAKKSGISSKVSLTEAHWATIAFISDEFKSKR